MRRRPLPARTPSRQSSCSHVASVSSSWWPSASCRCNPDRRPVGSAVCAPRAAAWLRSSYDRLCRSSPCRSARCPTSLKVRSNRNRRRHRSRLHRRRTTTSPIRCQRLRGDERSTRPRPVVTAFRRLCRPCRRAPDSGAIGTS